MNKHLIKNGKSPYWYVDVTHPVTGRRIRCSTKTSDLKEAKRFLEDFLSKLKGLTSDATLSDVIQLYKDPEDNPRYKQAQVEGRSYGKAYAKHVATHATQMEDLFRRKAPRLLKKPLCAVSKLDIKTIRELMVEEWGQTRKSQSLFRTLRAMFSQASEDALIATSPFSGIKDIHYDQKRTLAFTEDILREMIARKELWPDPLMWAYFSLLATTGMRRSEALALTRGQLYQGVLTIDRAYKDIDGELGLPKWGLTRVIPLSKTTQAILDTIPDEDERYFPKSHNWVNDVIRTARAVGRALFPLDPDISRLTAHSLRHSCHSNLLANGASSVLAAEYLSWSHQELLDIQRRYTHIYCQKLQPIADLIDEIYSIPKTKKKSQSV